MRTTLVAMLCVSFAVCTHAQEFERAESNPQHTHSEWYRQVESGKANIREVERLMKADTTVHHNKLSREAREALKWIATNRQHADMLGNVERVVPSDSSIQSFLAQSFPTKRAPSPQMISDRWRAIGPFGWDTTATMATGSQGVGVIRSVIVNPANGRHLLAGGISSGIWRSTDAGLTWKNVALETPIQTVWRFAWSGSTVFAATSHGLYNSQDMGGTWSKVSLEGDALLSTASAVDLCAVSPTDPRRIVVSAKNRLYMSSDAGSSWRQVCNYTGTWWDIQWHPTSNNVCYGLVQQGNNVAFVRSTGGGTKFDIVGQGYPDATNGRKMVRALLGVSEAMPDMVAVAIGGSLGDTLSGTYGIYVSTDQGSTFEHRCCGSVDGPEQPDAKKNPNLFDYDIGGKGLGQITWDMGFAVSNTNPQLMVVAGIFPYVSSDGGRSWSTLPAIHYDVQSVVIRGDSLWITTDGGVHLSPNRGASMQQRSFGISATEVWGFDQSHDGSVMTIGAYHLPIFIRDTIVYARPDPIDGWYAWSGADAMGANVNPIATEWLYAKPWSSVRGLRTKSKTVPPSASALGIDLGYITLDNLSVDQQCYFTLFGIDYEKQRVVSSRDNASSWITNKQFANWIYRLRVDPRNSQRQLVLGDNDLWLTTNTGATWNAITPPSALTKGKGIADMTFVDGDSAHILVAFNGVQKAVKVLESRDAGKSWSDLSVGLPEASMRMLASRRGTKNEYYAATNAGVYRYQPGEGWQLFGKGLPYAEVPMMQLNEKNGVMRVATSRGLWEIDLPATSVPQAQISYDTDTVRCSRNPVRFGCRSAALETSNFTRRWTFEGGQPGTSSDPLVNVFYSRPGTYSVRLSVSNEFGSDSMQLTDVITVLPSECDEVDPNTGTAVDLTGPEDHVTLGRFDGAIREFTFSAWVKPKGMQPGFSTILCSDSDPGVSQEVGMQFVNEKNEIGYLWTGGQWWWNSGLVVEPDVWSHVAMTIDSNGATVYVNGYPSSNGTKLPPLQLNSLIFKLGTYHYWSSRNFNGFIDEVALYSRKLSVSEIRSSMHRTHLRNEKGLIGYYQFNETTGSTLYEKISGMDGRLETGAKRAPSHILVGPGTAQTITTAAAGEHVVFPDLNVDVRLRNSVPANTNFTLSRLYVLPDSTLRPQKTLLGSWFVLDAFTLDKKPVEIQSILMQADSLLRRDQVVGRAFSVQTRPAWDVLQNFSPALASTDLQYDSSYHVLATSEISRGMLSPHQWLVSYRGDVVSVDNEEPVGLLCSPNPCSESFVCGPQPGCRNVVVRDITGRSVLDQPIQNGFDTVVDVRSLAPGAYLVTVGNSTRMISIIR